MKLLLNVVALGLLTVAMATPAAATNSSFENCTNGVDDNNDGLVDCDDPRCIYSGACSESGNCADGLDNDSDNKTDCRDSDCIGDPSCSTTGGGDCDAGGGGTPDECTPAFEDICDPLSGALFGLCNAYCEAMDCHLASLADSNACDKVLANFHKKSGGDDPPCLQSSCVDTCSPDADATYYFCVDNCAATSENPAKCLDECPHRAREDFKKCFSDCSQQCGDACKFNPDPNCFAECAGAGSYMPPTCDPATMSCP